jgi:hypothetical protein
VVHPTAVTAGERAYIYNVCAEPAVRPLEGPAIIIPEWLAKVLEYFHFSVIR